MRKLIFLAFVLHNIAAFSQVTYFETFDTKISIKNWKLITNGVVEHNNHFTFNGSTGKKEKNDLFFIFYDTANNPNYQFSLSLKFKAVPSKDISLRLGFFSNDSIDDYLVTNIKYLDKDKKTIFSIPPLIQKCGCYPIGIPSIGVTLNEKDILILKNADSMEITFYCYTQKAADKERKIIIDGIYLENILTSGKINYNSRFEIYPIPATKIIYFKFSSFLKPQQIDLYDYTGKKVIESKAQNELNIENIKPGFYFVTVLYETGLTATQKVEIR